MARFCSLFSGSSGNCTFVGTARGGVLIDAGVSARRIERALCERNIDPHTILAIFVTHEHTDHTAGIRVLHKRYGMPVYATAGTREELLSSGTLESSEDCSALTETVLCNDIKVTAFSTPHDSRESCGYRIELPDERKIAVATDIGHVSDTVRENLTGCDLIHIESNHDVRMLENGSYPYVLKRRILSDRGHLSNDACAAVLPDFLKTGTTRFSLGHLSRENNLPSLAYETAREKLTENGAVEDRDYLLFVAPPENDRPLLFL